MSFKRFDQFDNWKTFLAGQVKIWNLKAVKEPTKDTQLAYESLQTSCENTNNQSHHPLGHRTCSHYPMPGITGIQLQSDKNLGLICNWWTAASFSWAGVLIHIAVMTAILPEPFTIGRGQIAKAVLIQRYPSPATHVLWAIIIPLNFYHLKNYRFWFGCTVRFATMTIIWVKKQNSEMKSSICQDEDEYFCWWLRKCFAVWVGWHWPVVGLRFFPLLMFVLFVCVTHKWIFDWRLFDFDFWRKSTPTTAKKANVNICIALCWIAESIWFCCSLWLHF